jgi:prepilin-type N-terminal cleavage/methylation domain-containing protein
MRRRRGFSLIETSVAVALLAVIIVTVLSGFSATTLAATRHRQEAALDRLTRSDAEYIKSQAYNAAGNYSHLSASGYTFSYQLMHYNKNSNPQFATTNPDTGLQELALTVSGPNGISETLYVLKELP